MECGKTHTRHIIDSVTPAALIRRFTLFAHNRRLSTAFYLYTRYILYRYSRIVLPLYRGDETDAASVRFVRPQGP